MVNTTDLANKNGATLVVFENNKIKNIYLRNKTNFSIGRQSHINEPDVSLCSDIAGRNHGEIIHIGEDYFYIDKGSINGTYHNGKKIRKGFNKSLTPHLLCNYDVLRIDSEDLNYPDARGVWMMFVDGIIGNNWTEYGINNGKIIKIDEKIHCKIKYKQKQYIMYTYNKNQTILHKMDRIIVGNYIFFFTGNSIFCNCIEGELQT